MAHGSTSDVARRSSRALASLRAACAVTLLAGCHWDWQEFHPAADAATPDADRDAGADGGYRVDYGAATQLPVHGGDGGTEHTLECSPGDVLVGIHGRAGSVLQALGKLCAKLELDGTLTPSPLDPTEYGGNNEVTFTDPCPVGQVVVRVYGSTGATSVNQLGVVCAPVAGWIASGTIGQIGGLHGMQGGTRYDDQCPAGSVLYGFTVRAGAAIDALGGVCVAVRR